MFLTLRCTVQLPEGVENMVNRSGKTCEGDNELKIFIYWALMFFQLVEKVSQLERWRISTA